MAKDTFYYDILEVKPDATSAQIKKAYYAASLKHHPDKNLSDPEGAAARFKAVSEAYQVLSDPRLRQRYDELGKDAATQEMSQGFVDPRQFFRQMFGGDAFTEIIGDTILVQAMSEACQQQDGQGKIANHEQSLEVQRQHNERITDLSQKLKKRLSLYVDGLYTEWEYQEYTLKEALNLSKENYGPHLLNTIGYIYSSRAKQYLGKESFFGIAGFYHKVKETGHLIGSGADVVKSVRQMNELAKNNEGGEEKEPDIDSDQFMDMIWTLTKFDVEVNLREVCSGLLDDPLINKDQRRKRAKALKILGDSYKMVGREKMPADSNLISNKSK